MPKVVTASVRSLKSPSSKKWECLECLRSFVRKGDLTRHEYTHGNCRPHVCLVCGKGFIQSSGLKTHKNTHTKARPYKCSLDGCEAAFGDPSSCSRHRKEIHGLCGTFRCPLPDCHSSTKRRSTFTAHLKSHGIDPRTVTIDAGFSPPIPSDKPRMVQTHKKTSQVTLPGPFIVPHDSFYPYFPNDYSYERPDGTQPYIFPYNPLLDDNSSQAYGQEQSRISEAYNMWSDFDNLLSEERLFTIQPDSPPQPSSLPSLSPSPSPLLNNNYGQSTGLSGDTSQSLSQTWSCSAEMAPVTGLHSPKNNYLLQHAVGLPEAYNTFYDDYFPKFEI